MAFGALGLLMPLHLALPLVLAVFAWYLVLDARLALAFAVPLCALYAGAGLMGWRAHAGLFALGWAFQSAGHALFEKRPPAFFKNALFLPLGPLWLFAKAIGLA